MTPQVLRKSIRQSLKLFVCEYPIGSLDGMGVWRFVGALGEEGVNAGIHLRNRVSTPRLNDGSLRCRDRA